MKDRDTVLLWPPDSKKRSWKEDTPNEGISISLADNDIVDYHGDYQGFIVWDFHEEGSNMFARPEFTPTKDISYLAAYSIILECMEPLWHNPVRSTWPKIANKIVKKLKEEGWFEVEEASPEQQAKGFYFQKKGGDK